MKRETLEKAIQMREDIMQIERMSSILASGRKAFFEFREGYDSSKGSMSFSERMTVKIVAMLQEYKLELEREIEAL